MGLKGLVSKLLLAEGSAGNGDEVVETKYSQGIGSNGLTATSNGRGAARDARLTAVTFYARLFALFSFFLALCLAIALTVFQKKWVGKPSGLSGFLLFCISSLLLVLIVLTSAPLAAARTQGKKVAQFDRALREDRVGFVLMGWCLSVGFLISLTQLISSLVSKACKDPATDPHATSSLGNDDDYQKALVSFCGTKRATTAFLLMGWLACVGLCVIFLLNFRQSRKAGPRIPPFVHPGGESEGAFQAVEGEDPDEDAYGKGAQDEDYAARYRGYDDQYNYTAAAPGTPAPPGSYVNPLADVQVKYGMTQPLAISRPSYDPPQPVAVSRLSYEPPQPSAAPSNPFAEALANAQPLMSRPPPAPAYEQHPEQVNVYQAYGGYEGAEDSGHGDARMYQQEYVEHSYQQHQGGYPEQGYYAQQQQQQQQQYAPVDYQPRPR